MVNNLIPTHQRIQRVYPGAVGTVFFGRAHNATEHLRISTETWAPWISTDYEKQFRMSVLNRRAPRDRAAMMVLTRDGDVLISAAAGYECIDWGGVSHVGGGSHGALAREDSLGPLLFVGCGPRRPRKRPQWALRDLAPVLLSHFGVSMNGGAPTLGRVRGLVAS